MAAAVAIGQPLVSAAQEKPGLRRQGPPKRVIVLGAGPAGLVAALELKRAGHQVTLLEATLRVGGRVHTIRHRLSDGIVAEAGAGRFPPHHLLTFHYLRQFGLETVPFYPVTGLDTYLLAGKRLLAPRGKDPDMSQVPLAFTEEERKLGLGGLYAKFIGEPAKAFGKRWDGMHDASAARLGEVGFAEQLRARGASEAAIRFLGLGFDEISALDVLRDAAGHDVPMLYKVADGNDRLPRAMAERLSENIVHGAPAVRIAADEEGVQVTTRRAGGFHTFTGDYLICCLPFSVLRGIELTAAISEEKRWAIANSYYGKVTRVFLQMREKHWQSDGRNGFATLDQPMEVWHPTHNHAGRRGLLVGYTYEWLAEQYAALAPEARIEKFLDLAEAIHPGAKEYCEGGFSWSWHEQPYQRGAYLVTRIGDFARIYEASQRPEGRIHFAGEHTSPWPGWVQGALHSGLRAAREVNARTA